MKSRSKAGITVFLILIALFMVMFACIHVYGIGWTTTQVVSTESTDISEYPSLGVGSDGTVHITWDELTGFGGSGGDFDIFYKRFVPGSGWTTTEVVSTESTLTSSYPSLGVGSDGTVHIAWKDSTDYGGSGTGTDIFYKKYVPGTGWTTTEVVSTESTGDSRVPSLGVSSDGTVHIAWQDYTDYDGSGSDADIFYKRFEPFTGWTTTYVVSTGSTANSSDPSLGVGSDGTVHIAWFEETDYGGSGADYDVFYRRLVPGIIWFNTEVVSTESTSHSYDPSLAVGSDGTVHIAWRDKTNYGGYGTDWDIFYKKYVSGSGLTTTEVVSTESTNYTSSPSLGVGSDGTVHIAWEDRTDYGGSGADYDVFYKRFVLGSGWTTTEVVSTESTSHSYVPSLAVGSDGTVHIAWLDFTDYGGSGSEGDIFYKSLELDKTPPVIGEPTQQPSGDVQPDQSVTVSVEVQDSESGVQNVVLSYSIDDGGSWVDLTMSYYVPFDSYQAVIPEQTEGTLVKYMITAYDNAGNSAVKDNMVQYYVYTVIPELSTWLMLLLFMIATLAVMIYRKRD